MLGEDYLTTDSPPWSEQANTHVLLPHDVEDHATWVTPLQRSEQEEILALIGGRVLSSPYTESFPPPLVHFYRQKVTLHSHDQRLLQELWLQPPVFRGKPMKIISRGFPHANISMYYSETVPAMTQEDLVKAINANADEHLKAVVARNYEIQDVTDGPIFSGFMVLFATENWFTGRDFLGQPCWPLAFANARPSLTLPSLLRPVSS